MKDLFFGFCFLLCGVFSALVFSGIREGKYPSYSYVVVSMLPIAVGYYMLRYSALSLLEQSVVIALTSRIGYLCGLTFVGEHVSFTQWVGVTIMLLGSFLTNK